METGIDSNDWSQEAGKRLQQVEKYCAKENLSPWKQIKTDVKEMMVVKEGGR